MNKIKEQLRLKMLGQLSNEKTDLDVDNAYSVVRDVAISFSVFCAENYKAYKVKDKPLTWEGTMNRRYTTEELYKLFEDGLD